MSILESKSRVDRSKSGLGSPLDDGRVSAALEEYLGLASEIRRHDRAAFLARHAEIAPELEECLDGLDLVRSVGEEFDLTDARDAPETALPASTRLGDYKILREVGRGGMGIVYEAEQLSLGRRVALKVLATTGSIDPRHRQRFLVEAQAAALLQHENIVPVFGVGCERGVHYYAMQFIEGWSLAEVIQDLRFRQDHPSDEASRPPTSLSRVAGSSSSSHDRRDWRAVARLGLQAAEALDHSHAVGVLHRDIKPSNLMLDLEGHLWVADFGLARIARSDLGLTKTGDLVGTLRYMSPEHLRGDPAGIDLARADLYGLGVTLYELATLRPAFEARDRQVLIRSILMDEPDAPRRIDPSIPRDLETIVLKAMAKEPGSRYGSAREMAEDLALFLEDHTIRARRPGPLELASKWSRRHRSAVVSAALLILISLVVIVGSLWEAKRRTEAALATVTGAKIRVDAALKSASDAAWRGRMTFEMSHAIIEQTTALFASKRRLGDHVLSDREVEQACREAIAYNDRVARIFGDGAEPTEVAAKASRSSGSLRMLLDDLKGHDDYRRAIRFYETLAAKHPDFLWMRTGLIETETEYAGHLDGIGELSRADSAIHHALEVAEAAAETKQADETCFNMALKGAIDSLAWRLVVAPPSHHEDAERVARLVRKAIGWDPRVASFWRTLGVAQIRMGDWSGANESLRRSIDLGEGGGPIDWLGLALVRHHQGEVVEAKALFDRSEARLREAPSRDRDLLRFHAEVSRALKVPPHASPWAEAPLSLHKP